MTTTDQPILIIGSFVSPYVRKVLACLALKGLDYTVDPITPFFGNDEFTRLSPLRRIPVLVQGDLALSDSSVICSWLDEAYPERPALLPLATPADRARARWLEEFADSRMGEVFIWNLFYQKVVHPAVWREPGDAARITAALEEQIRPSSIIWKARCQRKVSCSDRTWCWPMWPLPRSSPTLAMPDMRWMRNAGRARQALSRDVWRIPPSPRWRRWKWRCCDPPKVKNATRPCWRQVRR